MAFLIYFSSHFKQQGIVKWSILCQHWKWMYVDSDDEYGDEGFCCLWLLERKEYKQRGVMEHSLLEERGLQNGTEGMFKPQRATWKNLHKFMKVNKSINWREKRNLVIQVKKNIFVANMSRWKEKLAGKKKKLKWIIDLNLNKLCSWNEAVNIVHNKFVTRISMQRVWTYRNLKVTTNSKGIIYTVDGRNCSQTE